MSCVSWRSGAIHFQNPIAMSVPVTHAATKPARDLRGARGTRRNGRREGRRGVTEPNIRPTVDAAVSAQDNLKRGDKDKTLKGPQGTYMRMATVATSSG